MLPKEDEMIRLLIIVIALCVGGFCSSAHAETFTNDLSASVWDIGGSYEEDVEGIPMSYTVSQDGKGKLTGYGSASGTVDGVSLNMDFLVKGKISSKKSITTIQQKLSIKGTASYQGQMLKFSGSVSMKTVVDEISRVMSGTITISLLGFKETESYYEDLSDVDMDGTVVLITSINEVEGKLIGDAVLELSNGRLIHMLVKGKDKNGQLLIQAKGIKDDSDSSGSGIKIIFDSLRDVVDFKAKALGQKLENIVPCLSPEAAAFSSLIVGKTLAKGNYKILSNTRFSWHGEGGNWVYTKTGDTTAKIVFTYDEDGNNPNVYREEALLTCYGERFLYRYSEYYFGAEDLSTISFGEIKF